MWIKKKKKKKWYSEVSNHFSLEKKAGSLSTELSRMITQKFQTV